MSKTVLKSRLPFRVLNALALITFVLLLSPLPFAKPVGAQTAPRVALITRNIPLPGADRAYVQHLTERGWNVTPINDDRIRNSGRNAINGYDLVIISSTVYPDRIGSRLLNAPQPIIVAEPFLYPSFRMTGTGRAARGQTAASKKLTISNSRNPLAAGFDGDVFVSTKAKPMNFGQAGADAIVVATAAGTPNRPVIFAYEAGARLVNGQIAAGPRVGFYMSQSLPGFTNRDGWALLDAAAAWATPKAPNPINTSLPPEPIAPNNGTLLGANVSKENFSSRFQAVRGFERQIRRKLDIINRFHEFSAGENSSFFWDRRHIEDGRTLMISWRATDNPGISGGRPDPQRARKIAAGLFDNRIKAMARALRDLEAPLLLRFNWEMDQDRGDPQYIGTPQEFIAAWRHVHGIFEEIGANNVEWVWAPRARSFAKNVGQTFYPGGEFVDWIGGSAVPVNSFTDVRTIYSAWNQWAANRAKPQLLWVGLRENPNDAFWKSGFINDIRTLASGQWSGLKAIVYYSSNSPLGFDYTIDTSSRSLSAYRNMACARQFTTINGC